MATISKHKVNGTVYELMDAQARKAIADMKAAISRDVELEWKPGTTFPFGWRDGYFAGSVGESITNTTSNFYIRAINRIAVTNYPELNNAIFITIQPPEGYAVKVWELDYTTSKIVAIYGQMNSRDYPELAGVPVSIPFNKNHYYDVSLGRFNDGDSADHLTSEFVATIKLIASVSDASNKMERTGTHEWFDVTVDRPLAFGGEEQPESTQTVECVLRLPTSYTISGKPTQLVLACHGASGYIKKENGTWYNSSWESFMDQLLAAGFAVFDANIFPTSTGTTLMGSAYGSPLYVNVLKKAYDYIRQYYNVTEKIFCHGTSMGGVGATAFSHAYPQLVLAESSFAGRDILRYIAVITGQVEDSTSLSEVPLAFGYESLEALNADKFSHVVGNYPSLSLMKYVDGAAVIPPDRETSFQSWMEYYTAPALLSRNDDPGIWMAKRTVPYKSWNSWADNEKWTKLEEVLSDAYNRGGSCPYYAVSFESGSHSQMSYGLINDMVDQLIAWYRRWE